MTAHTTGFVTRAELGLRKPKSVSTKIAPSTGGVGLHYGGPPAKIRGHADCLDKWRSWQDYHMDDKGWSDIAYTFGVCDHGYLLAGRGVGVRTAANGTDWGNLHFYAICWIGGEGEIPTRAAQDAIEYGIVMLRSAPGGNACGRAVWPHLRFKGTKCPGGALTTTAHRLHDATLNLPIPPVNDFEEEDGMYSLIRIDGGSAVYAVRPGVWEHVRNVPEFTALVAGGVTREGSLVRDLPAAQAEALKSFVERAF